jgi:hypothetical protein
MKKCHNITYKLVILYDIHNITGHVLWIGFEDTGEDRGIDEFNGLSPCFSELGQCRAPIWNAVYVEKWDRHKS